MPAALIVALAALAASTYFRHQQTRKIEQEQDTRLSQESARQRRIDEERQAALDKALPKLGRQAQEAQQGNIADQLGAYLTPQARPASDGEYTADTSAPKEIRNREARVLHDALTKGRDYARNLARVKSFGRQSMENSFDLSRLSGDVGRLNTESSRSSALLPLELQAAQSAGNREALLSDIAGAIGSIAGMYYAGAGGGAAAGAEGGTGITADPAMFNRTFPRTPGLDPARSGLGLKAPGVPRLQF